MPKPRASAPITSITNGILASNARGRRSTPSSLRIIRSRNDSRISLGALALRAVARAFAAAVSLGRAVRSTGRDAGAVRGPAGRPCGSRGRPVRLPLAVLDRPARLPLAGLDRPARVPLAVLDRPARVPLAVLDRPARVPLAVLDRPVRVPLAARDRPARAVVIVGFSESSVRSVLAFINGCPLRHRGVSFV